MLSVTGSVDGNVTGYPYTRQQNRILRPNAFNNVLCWHRGIVNSDGTELKDYAPGIGDFPMQLVNGPFTDGTVWDNYVGSFKIKEVGVGNFNGINESITLSETVVFSGNFGISYNQTIATAQGVVLGVIEDTTNYVFYSGTNIVVKINGIIGTFNSVLNTDKSISISRVGSIVTVKTSAGSQSLDFGDTGNFTINRIGRNSVGNYFKGMLHDLKINGFTVPFNDGQIYGDTTTAIHDSDGNVVGTLVSSNVPVFWGSTQAPYPIQIADIDSLLVDANGNSKTLTQTEMLAGCNVNGIDWFSTKRGYIKNTPALTGGAFTTRQTWMGL